VLLGYARPLEQHDLEKLHPSDDPAFVSELFKTAWNKELEKEAQSGSSAGGRGAGGKTKTKKASLLKALVSAYGYSYFVGAGEKFVYDAQQFVGPLLLQKLIQFLDARAKQKNGDDDDDHVPMRYSGIRISTLA